MSDSRPVSKSGHIFALPTGAELFEFKIEDLLGYGGFGITYLATDTLLEESVAIKEYLPNDLAVRTQNSSVRAKTDGEQPDFQEGLKSFLEEARLLARFRHPNIVHVRRFFEYHGTGYIVTEYIRGGTLSANLNHGKVSAEVLRGILDGVLSGLEQVHDRAILHRDLKPNNIILRENGQPVLIDFGAARDFRSRHSRSITAIATHGYSPPEQYGVGGQQGPWTDFYALGAIAYRAVTGEAPPDSLRRLRNDPLVPAKIAAPHIHDAALLDTIDWMLQLDEAKRPASVQEVRDALANRRAAASTPGSEETAVSAANAAQATVEGAPTARRSRTRLLALVAVSAAVTIGLGIFAYQGLKTDATQSTVAANEKTLVAAKFDGAALEKFLEACAADQCAATLRTQAQERLRLVKAEEDAFRRAYQNEEKLADYSNSCTACVFRADAQAQIKQIKATREDEERQRVAQEEARKKEAARILAEQQKAAAEKARQEQAERDRLAQEETRRKEAERQLAEQQKAAAEKAKREQAERELDRIAQEAARRKQAEQLLIEQQKAAAEKARQEQAERDRLAQEEATRKEAERVLAEQQKAAAEKARQEQAERDRLAQEEARRKEAERVLAEQQAAAEQAKREQAERDRLAQQTPRNDEARPAPENPGQVQTASLDGTRNVPTARIDESRSTIADASGGPAATSESTYRLASLPPSDEPAPPAAVPESVLVQQAQKELRRLRCFRGSDSGVFTDDTRSALKRYFREQGRNAAPAAITADIVSDLKQDSSGYCPPECDAGEHLVHNRCVAAAPARKREAERRERPKTPAAPAAEPARATARSSQPVSVIGTVQ
jgi:hypothetical protein